MSPQIKNCVHAQSLGDAIVKITFGSDTAVRQVVSATGLFYDTYCCRASGEERKKATIVKYAKQSLFLIT